MKDIKSKSLSVFIVLCLLLTSLFSTVAAEPISEENLNTEITNEHDGHSHDNSEPLKEEVQIEPTEEEGLETIDEPLEPPIEPPVASSCSHSWIYYDSPFPNQHYRFCPKCGAIVYEPHNFTYANYGDYHYTRCTICPLSRKEEHVPDPYGSYYSDNYQGHHQKCKLCGGNTKIVAHEFIYSGDSSGKHQAACLKCGYSFWEDHEGDGNIMGSDPMKYERCKKCNTIMYLPCTHSNKIYSYNNDNAHTVRCSACNEFLGFENHSYKKTDNGPDNHKLSCKYCGYEKGTEPHTFQWVSDGASGHHKVCPGCGREEGNIAHNLTYTSQGYNTHTKKCQTCNYSATESHNWDGVTVNDPYPHQHCIQCGQASENTACQHNNINAEEYDDVFHKKICADCGKDLGLESHDLEVIDLGNGKFDNYCPVCGFTKITTGVIPK